MNLKDKTIPQLRDLISDIMVSCADYRTKTDMIKEIEAEINLRLYSKATVVNGEIKVDEL